MSFQPPVTLDPSHPPFLSADARLRLAKLEAAAPGLELWPALSPTSPPPSALFAADANAESIAPTRQGTVLEVHSQSLTLEDTHGIRCTLPLTSRSDLPEPPGARLEDAPGCPPAHLLQPGDRVGWTRAQAVLKAPESTGNSDEFYQIRLLAPLLSAKSGSSVLPGPHRRPGGGASLAQLHARAGLIRALRDFFEAEQFLEVETPILAAHAGLEPHLDPFETRFRFSPEAQEGRPLWLLTSPEYCLKRLVAAGVSRVFQLGKVFRNGEVGPNHNPEFTMLEWYRAWADYRALLSDTERLGVHLLERSAQARGCSDTPHQLCWQGKRVDCRLPWQRLTVREAFLEHAGLDLAALTTPEALREAAAPLGIHLPADASWDELYFRILLERVEPQLGLARPTFLMDYPAQFAALSRVRPGSFPVAERFELYIAGVEVANAYSELNDPVKQALRFAAEQEERRSMGAPVFEPDPAYLRMLESGLPPTAGIALGVDRLIMLLIDAPNIRETLAFPFPMSE